MRPLPIALRDTGIRCLDLSRLVGSHARRVAGSRRTTALLRQRGRRQAMTPLWTLVDLDVSSMCRGVIRVDIRRNPFGHLRDGDLFEVGRLQ
ncbi:hypothetical protein AWC24_14635 [Mycolicibacter senuensis]|nr:hypothetical protein AWC24_14635 [Mycolicibacter senuensis]